MRRVSACKRLWLRLFTPHLILHEHRFREELAFLRDPDGRIARDRSLRLWQCHDCGLTLRVQG